jgi:hypothetical protein
MKQIAITLVACAAGFLGCRSDDRPVSNNNAPVVTDPGPAPAPAPAPAPEAIGGGPTVDMWSREGAIDRLANARCEARERCGAVGKMTSDHTSFGECVSVARAELNGSFGASTCENYDSAKIDGCARELSDSPCGTETKLSENCVESKLCK